MTIDRYTKFVLTAIAIGIWALAFALFFQPVPIRATGEEQDINIEKVGGSYVGAAIPVEIQGTVVIDFEEEPVFEISD